MGEERATVYPYVPNSVPEIKRQMLEAVGAESPDDFFEDVPENLRLRTPMNLPEPLLSEYALKRHVEGLLNKNRIFIDRTRWVGPISQEDAIGYGFTGPCLRAAGVNFDIRKAHPYYDYDQFEFD